MSPRSASQPVAGAGDPADITADIRQRALRLLGRREHSRLELRHKLQERGFRTEDVDPILDTLAQDGSLSDERMTESYVAERLAKGFGPVRVRADLQRRGISDTLIDRHLRLDDARCFELLRRVDAKRHPSTEAAQADALTPEESRRETMRRARFLESRGFPSHLIARLLSQDDAFSP